MAHPGCKPVHLNSGRKAQGRQAMWEAMRKQRSFTAKSIAYAVKANVDTVKTYIACLSAAGHLVPAEDGFELIRDTGIDAPRVTKDGKPVTQGAAREQMWRSMKMMKADFDYHELAVLASTDTSPVSPVDANDYLQALTKAGYLQIAAKGGPNRAARYRFIPSKNTGPKPPQIQRVKSVWDPNLGRIVWQAAVRDE